MAGGFTVNPDSFEPVAGQLRSAADALPAEWAPVRSQTQSVKFGRGDDPVSPLIQVTLQAAVELVDSSVTSSAKALHGYADGLSRMGRTYHATEQSTTQLMSAR